jgi:hypothetical protein
MFFRRRPTPPTVTVTNESFRRWLRAYRPPWAWFLGLSELEQEQLAMIGDEHSQDVLLALGHAIADPSLAEAGVAASRGDARGEEALVRRIAESFATAIAARTPAPAAPAKAPTMAGIGQRSPTKVASGSRRNGIGLPGGDA